jgi:hypothetical protein
MNLSTSLMTTSLVIFGGLFTRWKQHPPDLDQQVLDQLKKAGSNFSKPHDIEFFLYFPSEAAATSAAQEVEKEVGSVEVKHGANSPEWLCFATKRMAPAHGELVRLRTRFDNIASRLDGKYDGWGTEVVN